MIHFKGLNSQELLHKLGELRSQIVDTSNTIKNKEALILDIRQLTCTENNPPLQELLDSNIVDLLVSMEATAGFSDDATLNLIWILTNICSGNQQQTQKIIQMNGLKLMVKYCKHENIDIVIQSIWGIGNISGDSIQMRDLVIQSGLVQIVCDIFENRKQILTIVHYRTLAWIILNLVRGKPLVPQQEIGGFFPHIISLLQMDDKDILTDTQWALNYISSDSSNINHLVNLNIAQYLKPHPSMEFGILTVIIRNLGNLASGADHGVDNIIEQGCLVPLINCGFQVNNLKIKAYIGWTLSNIAAGTENQKQILMNLPEFNYYIESHLSQKEDSNFDITNEFYWIMGNLFQSQSKVNWMLFEKEWPMKWLNNLKMLWNSFTTPEILLKVFQDGMYSLMSKDVGKFTKLIPEILELFDNLSQNGIIINGNGQKIIDLLNDNHDQIDQELIGGDPEVLMVGEISSLHLDAQYKINAQAAGIL